MHHQVGRGTNHASTSPTRIPILFLGNKKRPPQVLTHSFSQFCTLPTQGTCSFCKWESRHPGKEATISISWTCIHVRIYAYASIRRGGPVKQPLLVAERTKAHLVTEKAEVDTESYTARIVSTANVRRPITQVTPLIGTCLYGLCPFRIMPPSFISSWCLHLVLPFSDFGHSTAETASNRQVGVSFTSYKEAGIKMKDRN